MDSLWSDDKYLSFTAHARRHRQQQRHWLFSTRAVSTMRWILYAIFWLHPHLDREAIFQEWAYCGMMMNETVTSSEAIIKVMLILVSLLWCFPLCMIVIYDWIMGVACKDYFSAYKIKPYHQHRTGSDRDDGDGDNLDENASLLPSSTTSTISHSAPSYLTSHKERLELLLETAKRRGKSLLQLCVIVYFTSHYVLSWWRDQCHAPFPSRWQVIWQCMGGFLLASTIFFVYHRILHLPQFYHIHKPHHTFKSPISSVTDHAEPIESLVGTIMVILPIVVFKMHLWTMVIFYIVSVAQGLYEHCGYHLPLPITHWMPFGHNASRNHYAHHEQFNVNYGAFFPLWDMLFRYTASPNNNSGGIRIFS